MVPILLRNSIKPGITINVNTNTHTQVDQMVRCLPVELWVHVFSFLGVKDRCSARGVCVLFHEMLDMRWVWKDMFLAVPLVALMSSGKKISAVNHPHLFRVCPWEDARELGNYALQLAVKGGCVDIVRLFHARLHLTGEDARACDNYALRTAVRNGDVKMVKTLAGLFHLTVEDARCALYDTFSAEDEEMVEALVELFDFSNDDLSFIYKDWY